MVKVKKSFKDKVKSNAKKAEGRSYGHLSIPDGVDVFSLENNSCKVKFDIVNYVISDPKHLDRDEDEEIAMVGDEWYKKPYKVHRGLGAEHNISVVCLNTWGEKCPICERRKKLNDEGASEEEINALNAQKKNLYVVIPREGKSKDKISIYDVSYGNFQKRLKIEMEDEDCYDFADLAEGKTLQTTFTEASFGKNKYPEAQKIKFIERGDLSKLAKNIPDLDKVLIKLSYDKAKAVLLDEDIDEDVDDAPEESDDEPEEETPRSKKSAKPEPVKKSKKAPEPEPEEEEDETTWEDLQGLTESKLIKLIEKHGLQTDPDDYDDSVNDLRKAIAEELGIEIPKPKKSAKLEPVKPSKKRAPEPEDEEDEDEEDDEDKEEEEEEEKPKKGSVRASTKSSPTKSKKKPEPEEEDEDEDEDEEEEEEEEAPAKKRTSAPAKKPSKKVTEDCPHGHRFGIDCDKKKECKKCDLWDICVDYNK
jgi:hypothetical protein